MLNQLTPEDVLSMDYNQLIGVVRETNRPPGGAESVARLAQRAFLNRDSEVLEIGTSTGFTCIELARLVGNKTTAIDINQESIDEASRRAKRVGVADRITFKQLDATNTAFGDEAFDMVFCGNVTSLIPNREAALTEYCRVLRDGGFVAAIPMFYVKPPSDELVKAVSDAIHVNIVPLYRDFWVEFFDRAPLQLYWAEDYHFDRISDETVERFVEQILRQPHLAELRKDTREVLVEKYTRYMYLFRENLAHMGYTLMLLRKERYPVDPPLFTSHRVSSQKINVTPSDVLELVRP